MITPSFCWTIYLLAGFLYTVGMFLWLKFGKDGHEVKELFGDFEHKLGMTHRRVAIGLFLMMMLLWLPLEIWMSFDKDSDN